MDNETQQQNEKQPLTAPILPQSVAQPAVNATVATTSPGVIVLQWLTYAFWGWTILSLASLITSVISLYIDKLGGTVSTGQSSSNFTPYAIAAVLVLFPISLICDYFYSKSEPQKKTGAAMLVMVVHAVIFALFGIASVIVAVFSVVQLLTNSSSTQSTGTSVALYSSIIIAIVYAITFLRTLNPHAIPFAKRLFIVVISIIIGIFVILGITGPVSEARSSRGDVLLTNSLMDVSNQIAAYTEAHNDLPASLGILNLSKDAAQVVSKKLIEYKPNTQAVKTTDNATTRYYQLCVTYDKASSSSSYYSTSYDSNSYSQDTINTISHNAGPMCYKISHASYDWEK